jgi:serine/threonine protein kinase
MVLENPNTVLSDQQIAELAYSTLMGMIYLHKNKIIHNNIKSDNVILDDQFTRLSDFSYSEVLDKNNSMAKSSFPLIRGTINFMPPERLIKDEKYDFSADIWSFGIFLLELIEGEPILVDESDQVKIFFFLLNFISFLKF